MGLHDLGAAKKSNYCTWNNWRHRREWRAEIEREQVVKFFLILVHEFHSDKPEPLVNLRTLQTLHMLTLLQRRDAERTEISEEEKYKVFNSFFIRERSISALALRHNFKKMRQRQKKGLEKGGCDIKFVVVVVRCQ